jgi:ribonuclease HI
LILVPQFTCSTCQKPFTVPDTTLAKFPGWVPKQCLGCKKGGSAPVRSTPAATTFRGDGPETGVFTDGSATPNPGPGGWAAVYVVEGKIVAEKHGHEPHTTNNRMELRALIAGYSMVPAGIAVPIYTDSNLCVQSITQWAPAWKRNGWRKKDGEIKNLELVQELFALAQARPDVQLTWIKAHVGYRWNEYADQLAGSYRR